jgi:hypothetical protein
MYVHMYRYRCMAMDLGIDIYVQIYLGKYVSCIYLLYRFICIDMATRLCIYINTQTHTHTHARARTHARTHARMNVDTHKRHAQLCRFAC